MRQRLVVIGGDAGGMSAASQARRRKSPEELEIVAFERGNFTSYSACGIPYFVGDVIPSWQRLIARPPKVFRDKYSIDARTRHEVTSIDVDGKSVEVVNLETGEQTSASYDYLLIATGAVPLRPPLEGIDSKSIFGVQTLDDGIALKTALEQEAPSCAVIVGGGYIGLEIAEAFAHKGLKVSLVEGAPQPMTTLDPDMGALVADAMRGMGIDVHTSEPVKGFDTKNGAVQAVVTEAGTIPADMVVLGLGARPNSALASAADIRVGETTGGIDVTDRMQTSAPGVWAAGDVVEKLHRVSGKKVAVPLGTHANKEGRVAGIDITGGDASFPGIVGTAVAKVCDVEISRTGLKETDARALGFDVMTAIVDSTTRAGYFPGAAPIKTKVVFERGTGRLLGAQIVGREGAAKRIDVCAVALWNDMTVGEMLNLDLSYAPPFSPLWDPVLVAARQAWGQIKTGE